MKRSRYIAVILVVIWFVLAGGNADAERGIKVKRIHDLSHESEKLGAYKALIIGINDYKGPKIPDLETAINDATAMAKVLKEKYGFKVTLLLDREATKEAIYKGLRNLAASTKPNDSVLIYFAGHGDLDRTYDDGWWIPADAIGGNPYTYLDNVQVQKAMRSMKARHVLLISDSCYAGTLFGKARSLPPVIDDEYYLSLYNEKSRWGITSGNKTPVSDQGSSGHSVFAYQLIKELERSDKPFISTQEIYTRIAPIIANNSEQTPLCSPVLNTGDQGGQFVFVASVKKEAVIAKEPSPTIPQRIIDKEMLFWQSIQDSDDPALFEAYLKTFRNGTFVPIAKRKIEAFKQKNVVASIPPNVSKPRLFVEVEPGNAKVRILNIRPKFHQGMELDPGRYHVEVSDDGYETKKMWIKLENGKDETLQVSLDKSAVARSGEITVKLRATNDPGAPVSEVVNLYEKSYALVIGIDDYTGGWPKLNNAVADAKEVAAELEKHGFEVTFKENLDSEGLNKSLKEFFALKGADPDARLFFWYGGHGHTRRGEGYLVPSDAPLPTAPRLFRWKAIHMRDFGGYMRLADSKHVFAVFDSCFAGTIFQTRADMVPAAITRATTKPVRQFMTSGDTDQEVSDDGTFRKLFLRALRGETEADYNGDGYLMGTELGLYLSGEVTNITEQAQTPRYGKLRDVDYNLGDFIFLLPERGGAETASSEGPKEGASKAAVRTWQEEAGNDETLHISLEQKTAPPRSTLTKYLKAGKQQTEMASLPSKQKYTPPSSFTENDRDGIYIAYANGVVRDTKTGLDWVAGPDRDTDWNEARSWVQSLNLDAGGWRMPTMAELGTLYKTGTGSRNMTPLLKTTGWEVWSGETYGPSMAHYYNFHGNSGIYYREDFISLRGFAVRTRSDG